VAPVETAYAFLVREREEPLGDPYRTLGVEPGASMAEVKRAYRRLAKAFHPDSAGEAALPRFLAIHEAYELLNSGRARVSPHVSPTRPTNSTTSEPWRADPDRARAAREQARTRRRGTAGGTGTAHGSGAGAARGAAGRTARPAGTAAGAHGSSADTGSTGTAGAASGSTETGSTKTGSRGSGASGSGGSSRRASGRRRDVRKATLGSTSYDEARDPADATWSGASWYGPTSGEYWIVNPREYADPRKHGPGYQQRGRRPSGAAGSGPLDGDGPFAGTDAVEPDAGPEPVAGAAPAFDPGEEPVTARGNAGRAGAAGAASSIRDARGWASSGRAGWTAAPATERAHRDTDWQDRRDGPGDAGFDPLGPFGAAGRDWLGNPADDPIRRLGIALVAWPPIGLAAAAAIGEVTGCAAYSAECGGSDMLLPWLAQAAILGLLLLLPPLARLFVGGTIAVLLALVPITAFLLVVGAGGAPQAGFALGALLALAWLGGVGWTAFGGRRRRARGAAP
jgi:curved DNA-binding protein CbpA